MSQIKEIATNQFNKIDSLAFLVLKLNFWYISQANGKKINVLCVKIQVSPSGIEINLQFEDQRFTIHVIFH